MGTAERLKFRKEVEGRLAESSSQEQWFLEELRILSQSPSEGDAVSANEASVGVVNRVYAQAVKSKLQSQVRKSWVLWIAVLCAVVHQTAVLRVLWLQACSDVWQLDNAVLVTFIGASYATAFSAFVAIARAHDWTE